MPLPSLFSLALFSLILFLSARSLALPLSLPTLARTGAHAAEIPLTAFSRHLRRTRRAGRLAQHLGEGDAPTQLALFLPGEIDRPVVDLDQCARAVADIAIRVSSLDRRCDAGQRSHRVVDAAVDIIGGQRHAIDRLQRHAQLEHMAIIALEVGVAAADARDGDGFPVHIIIDADILRRDKRAVELGEGRRGAILIHRGDQRHPVRRRPVDAIAEGAERAEIRHPRRRGVEIGRQRSDFAQKTALLAGKGNVEAGLRAQFRAVHVARTGEKPAPRHLRFDGADRSAETDAGAHIPRRHSEQLAHRHEAGAAGVRLRDRAVAQHVAQQRGRKRPKGIDRRIARRDR